MSKTDKINQETIQKSLDELDVQWRLARKEKEQVFQAYTHSVESELLGLRTEMSEAAKADTTNGEAKNVNWDKKVKTILKSVKKAEKQFAESFEDLLKDWRKEMKADFKNANRYDNTEKLM